MAARRFLYVVAALIVLTLGSAFAYRMWGQRMLNAVMVPSARFAAPRLISANDYADRANWLARPDITQSNASLWVPKGVRKGEPGPVAVFYVHPTSYMAPFNTARWNAPLQDKESTDLARRFTMMQGSAFNSVGNIWAPRYHQAHFGAFLSTRDDAAKAIDAAYKDIAAAFTAFLAANPSGPILLAAHSQGSLHLMRLMKEKVAGKPVADRIVAAYLVGWPVSITADLPAMGLPACETADQTRCILSWQSFAEPADTSHVIDAYNRDKGLNGKARAGTPMLCTNPLTGMPDTSAPEKSNRGSLVSTDEGDAAPTLVKGAIPARCEDGFLLIGSPPQVGNHVLPGNNYHVYDYAMFWANIRADAEKRLTTFLTQQ